MHATSLFFPPHWFCVSRVGTAVTFALVPCATNILAHQWRLYHDSLRTSDFVPLIESLKHEPQHLTLVLCCVDTIDTAHYLMHSARVALDAVVPILDNLFTESPKPQTFQTNGDPLPSAPSEPLPDGHPDSFSMDALRAELGEKPPVPYGTKYNQPTRDEEGEISRRSYRDTATEDNDQ